MEQPSKITPLAIISTFCGIVEIAMSIGWAQTSGVIQYIFVGFAVGFPVLIVLLFFSLIRSENYYKLYSPSEFQDPTMFKDLFMLRNRIESIESQPEIKENLAEAKQVVNSLLASPTFYKYDAIYKLILNSPEGMTAKDISNKAGVSRSYTHRVLPQLISSGLIQAESSSEDFGERSRRIISLYKASGNRETVGV